MAGENGFPPGCPEHPPWHGARCRCAPYNAHSAVSCMREALRSEGWDPAERRCPGPDWPKTAGPGLAVKWIARSRFAPSGHFHALLRSIHPDPPSTVSCMREALRREGWDPAERRCPGPDWPKTAGPGLAVKWIARSRFASSGHFHALLRSSCAWLAAHEKALPRSRQGDHQVPRTGLEPAQPFGHYPLKVACLPISPPGLGRLSTCTGR